jgi:hypothetical protein
MTQDTRYPVGKFSFDITPTPADRERYISEVAAFPTQLRAAVSGASAADFERTYRPGGWTVRQVIHHVADSHMNGYVRFRLALTADSPRIVAYDEAKWAELADVHTLPPDASLTIVEGVHARWVALAKTLSDADFSRGYFHPEHNRIVPAAVCLAQYAWHSRHHLAHVNIGLGRA